MESRIFGVDIASGSPHSRSQPSYALCMLEGEDKEIHNMISRHKLIRLIRDKKPDIIAVDNVHELASGRKGLIEFMRQLPLHTRIVQVTGGAHPQALPKIARWHGISFHRLDPTGEAEACALLAARGVGQVLSAFEDHTRIKVSRRRSPGRGGWSQNRYSRKIHGAVRALARDVEKDLRAAGLEYTSRAVEGLGGYIRSEFIVDAPRDKVPVKTSMREDAQIRVEGIERRRLQFHPLKPRREYIIAGIDPGTTTGLAAINLSGELVDLTSSRTMSSAEVIEWIAARGKPLIVATDVFPPPTAVEKVKRAFNAVISSPGEVLSAEEKISMARPFGYRNDHERDALAAALSAFRKYRNKFLQVEKKASNDIDPDEVKALVVAGYSIERALAMLTPPSPQSRQPEVPKDVIPASPAPEEVRQLQEQIRHLRDYLEEVRQELARKDQALMEIEGKLERERDKEYREMRRDSRIRFKDKEIERLKGILRSERKLHKKLRSDLQRLQKAKKTEELEGLRRLKPLESFSREEVQRAKERWAISPGDVVILVDPSGGGTRAAEILTDLELEAVVSRGEMPGRTREYLELKGVPVIDASSLDLKVIDGIYFVQPQDLQGALESWKEGAKEREAERKAQWLEGMIQEYRVARRREEMMESKAEKGTRKV